MKHPAAVTACNLDLENLITDVNRSIATLAITTLLKVSSVSFKRWIYNIRIRDDVPVYNMSNAAVFSNDIITKITEAEFRLGIILLSAHLIWLKK